MRQPSVMLVYTGANGAGSYFAFDEGGEVIETVELDAGGQPDWADGGICDGRGAGGQAGFDLLHSALTLAEANARMAGIQIERLETG